MQTQKDNIKQQILMSAEKLFRKKGFRGTSMREIAIDANIGLSNIYNYFKNKDSIFKTLVKPSINELMQLFKKNHRKEDIDIEEMSSPIYFEAIVNEYIELIITNRGGYELLFFNSKGSSLENFKAEFTNYATIKSKKYILDINKKYPSLDIDISDLFLTLSTSGMINLLEMILSLRVNRREIKPIITEYMTFNMAGWKELMKI